MSALHTLGWGIGATVAVGGIAFAAQEAAFKVRHYEGVHAVGVAAPMIGVGVGSAGVVGGFIFRHQQAFKFDTSYVAAPGAPWQHRVDAIAANDARLGGPVRAVIIGAMIGATAGVIAADLESHRK